MTDAANTWTDERVELLKKLWADGLSASQIAAEIGSVTRNAVIGKVHRLGLSGRVKPSQQGNPRPKKAAPSRPATPVASVAPVGRPAPVLVPAPAALAVDPEPARPVEPVAVPVTERVTIMELREFMCRWPLGDPTSAEFRFCGARSITGLPYCNHHASVAYQPAADRKRQDRRLVRL